MGQKNGYPKLKFILGCVTLVAGFLASNIALFQWIEQTGMHHLLGKYSRYVCGYGGFAAMISGVILINDFLVLQNVLKGKYVADHEITEKKRRKRKRKEGRQKEKKRLINGEHQNWRETIAVIYSAIFLSMLCPMVVSSVVSYTATVIITPQKTGTLDLYVNSFDATRDQWAKTGSSPYLGAQDEPNNYVYGEKEGTGSQHGAQVGDFGFEDTTQTGMIVSAKLRVYGHASTSKPVKCHFSVYLWDGVSWTKIMDFQNEGSYEWKETDVSSSLDTWDKINGAKVYLQTEDPEGEDKGEHACDAALLRVEYT